MYLLGLESSCDETAAAVIRAEGDNIQLCANVVASQVDLHARYGGVVPELASREHLRKGLPVIQEALKEAEITRQDIDAIAVTAGPGLIGALLVGLQMGKSLAAVWDCDFIGVDHLHGHLQAIYLEAPPHPPFPFLALLVSGGHTAIYRVEDHLQYALLGATRDDAAGEAFDKAAKMMGLPYPGGVHIDRLAAQGQRDRFHFPRAMLNKGLDFSFSGLKTACRSQLQKFDELPEGALLSDVCASYQEAIADVLWKKCYRALQQENCKHLVLTGGVAANSRLREMFEEQAAAHGLHVYLPSRRFCTDNAAMIACAGYRQWQSGQRHGLGLNAYSRSPEAQQIRSKHGRAARTTP